MTAKEDEFEKRQAVIWPLYGYLLKDKDDRLPEEFLEKYYQGLANLINLTNKDKLNENTIKPK